MTVPERLKSVADVSTAPGMRVWLLGLKITTSTPATSNAATAARTRPSRERVAGVRAIRSNRALRTGRDEVTLQSR